MSVQSVDWLLFHSEREKYTLKHTFSQVIHNETFHSEARYENIVFLSVLFMSRSYLSVFCSLDFRRERRAVLLWTEDVNVNTVSQLQRMHEARRKPPGDRVLKGGVKEGSKGAERVGGGWNTQREGGWGEKWVKRER